MGDLGCPESSAGKASEDGEESPPDIPKLLSVAAAAAEEEGAAKAGNADCFPKLPVPREATTAAQPALEGPPAEELMLLLVVAPLEREGREGKVLKRGMAGGGGTTELPPAGTWDCVDSVTCPTTPPPPLPTDS